jgi:hypothetical protein
MMIDEVTMKASESVAEVLMLLYLKPNVLYERPIQRLAPRCSTLSEKQNALYYAKTFEA